MNFSDYLTIYVQNKRVKGFDELTCMGEVRSACKILIGKP